MDRYERETGQLEGWFRNRLKAIEPFEMTEEDYLSGVDQLPPELNSLTKEANAHWLTHRKYELSYRQMCRAFFAAAGALGKITLLPKHPTFRLHTAVLIKEVVDRETGDRTWNVPGTITSVCGEDHVVTGAVGLGNYAAERWSVIIQTKDLEQELSVHK